MLDCYIKPISLISLKLSSVFFSAHNFAKMYNCPGSCETVSDLKTKQNGGVAVNVHSHLFLISETSDVFTLRLSSVEHQVKVGGGKFQQ